jgi:hypothetical protein
MVKGPVVEREDYEAVHPNRPVFGLVKAAEHVPAIGGRETARRRLLRGKKETSVP